MVSGIAVYLFTMLYPSLAFLVMLSVPSFNWMDRSAARRCVANGWLRSLLQY